MVPAGVTAGATFGLVHALSENGLSAVELVWASLFTFLFGLASIGLFTATVGFFSGFLSRRAPTTVASQLPRSVLVMPIYHENPEHVFAALIAMRESLNKTPGGDAFEIFVLAIVNGISSTAWLICWMSVFA